jgi:hypothetical protein
VEYVPAKQFVHEDIAVAPSLEDFPAGQFLHAPPEPVEYVPAKQFEHEPEPCGEDVPAGQL